jgi:hypothetical protein
MLALQMMAEGARFELMVDLDPLQYQDCRGCRFAPLVLGACLARDILVGEPDKAANLLSRSASRSPAAWSPRISSHFVFGLIVFTATSISSTVLKRFRCRPDRSANSTSEYTLTVSPIFTGPTRLQSTLRN